MNFQIYLYYFFYIIYDVYSYEFILGESLRVNIKSRLVYLSLNFKFV